MKLLRPARARDVAIVAAVVALGGAALADTIRDGTASGGRPAGRETSAATTAAEAAPRLRLPPVPAPGRIALTEAVGCALRVVDARSGTEADLPRVATSCELWAPRVGGRVAYGVDTPVATETQFRILDLTNPEASFGEYKMSFGPMAWAPDGWTLAWCDSAGSGFELELGNRPRRLDHCPRAYNPGGTTAYALGPEVFIGGHRLLRAGGHVHRLAWGLDASLAVVVDGRRVERYEGDRLAQTATLDEDARGWPIAFSPDNCAALMTETALVRLLDLGCFRGRRAFTTLSVDNCTNRPADVTLRCARYPAPRTFEGIDAAWSPDGEWIAVAEPDAVVFHRVIGRYAAVRWPVAAAQLVWLLG